jgi:hypothetical protein
MLHGFFDRNEAVSTCNRRGSMRMRTAWVTAAAACLLGTAVWAMASKQKTVTADGSAAKPVSTEKPAAADKGWKLVAYYLHGTYRCPTCLSIEKQSKEDIEGDFAKEIKAGKVVFLSLNYEESPNTHFGDDYKLTTRSLVLSLRRDGKEVKWRNLPEIWTRVHNPPSFREYVNGEVKAMLKEMN